LSSCMYMCLRTPALPVPPHAAWRGFFLLCRKVLSCCVLHHPCENRSICSVVSILFIAVSNTVVEHFRCLHSKACNAAAQRSFCPSAASARLYAINTMNCSLGILGLAECFIAQFGSVHCNTAYRSPRKQSMTVDQRACSRGVMITQRSFHAFAGAAIMGAVHPAQVMAFLISVFVACCLDCLHRVWLLRAV
jgi:hypothetical protein